MLAHPLAPDWLARPDDVNALAPQLWPSSAKRGGERGELEVGGVRASRLAAEYGTPLYVIDEADARARARRIRSALEAACARVGTTGTAYYAGKAFLSTAVAQWMAAEGLNIDTASGGELAVALAAGVDPARIGLHGNNKSDRELDQAVRAGVGAIVIDAVEEIDRVAAAASRHGRVQRVRLRTNSGVHAHTHEYLATAREDQKFGVPLADIEQAVERIRDHAGTLEFLGLHSHIGSQILVADGFLEAATRLLAVHARLLAGGPVPQLNLGGGFGIAYVASDEPAPIADLLDRMLDTVAEVCRDLDIPVPAIAIEPGRSIIGPAGVTLYEVGTIKDVEVALDEGGSAVRRYVSVDGGMSDNARPALYGADYAVRLASRASDAEPQLVRIAGKHCESGDIVVDADYLPADVHRGDLVAVPATGAYCYSLSSNYNHLARPAVVAVNRGEARLIVRGETVADLLRRDVGATDALEAPRPEGSRYS
ncbi:diaminopimelate decarboxylase [Microcella putealis]|uniref:Diaminopimelate decarboxylase n=1 Tax=Microcella putealis TaxID=337005 RepID=A0A4Q7LXK5_9MICO|nr:diaminopimelate decarboxylase [Microcella putealis]RZS59182.1 diaminopimelate decarboxylase [Microcella putealis]TQM24208.1 diaminopimelate decarboxylase [Microcella putealis]